MGEASRSLHCLQYCITHAEKPISNSMDAKSLCCPLQLPLPRVPSAYGLSMTAAENDHHRGVKFAPPPSSSLAHAPRSSSSRTRLHGFTALGPGHSVPEQGKAPPPRRRRRHGRLATVPARIQQRRPRGAGSLAIRGSQPLAAPSPAAEQARAGGHGSGVELDLGCCGPESSSALASLLHMAPPSSRAAAPALASLLPVCSCHMRLRREAMQFCIPSLLQRQFALLIASPVGELCGHVQ
jgi:hypothetical protein